MTKRTKKPDEIQAPRPVEPKRRLPDTGELETRMNAAADGRLRALEARFKPEKPKPNRKRAAKA